MLKNLIRDWWRGFTNDDLSSVLRKTEYKGDPGEIVWLTDAEYRAWRAFKNGVTCHHIHVR